MTFRVEEFVLLAARARALRERGSLNGVIYEFLEAYSGVRIPDEFRPRRRIPQVRRVRVPEDPFD